MKVDGAYYRDVLLSHQMLPAIRHLAGDVFMFQHVSQSSICARLHLNSYHLTYGRSPDLNPVDYKIWGRVQERVYQKAVRDVD